MSSQTRLFSKSQLALLLLWVITPGLFPPIGDRGSTVAVSDVLGAVTVSYTILRFCISRFSPSGAHIALFVHLAVALASSLVFVGHDFFPASLGRAIRFALICSPAFILLFHETTHDQFVTILKAYLVAATLGAALPLLAYAGGLEAARAVQTIDLTEVGVVNRAGGWVGDSSAFGHQIASVCVVFVAALVTGVLRLRMIHVAIIGVVAYGLYATSSRSAVAAIALALLSCGLIGQASLKGKVRTLLLLVSVASFAVLGLAIASSLGIAQGLDTVVHRLIEPFLVLLDSSQAGAISSGRLENWTSLHDRLGWQWVWGAGFGALPSLYGIADNVLIKTLGETGLLGAASLAALILFLARRLWRERSNPIAAFGMIVLCGQVANALFVDTLTFYSSMPPVVTLVFLSYKYARDRRRRAQLTLANSGTSA